MLFAPQGEKLKPIGVFDSGIGGLSVARAIEKALPGRSIIFVHDSQHFPYATKSPNEILGYVVPILEDLVSQGCQVIVVACNTVSTTLIEKLRNIIKVPLIAIEPMVKPAAQQSRAGVIAVCATPTTLASKRYGWLKNNYAKGVKVLEPDCSKWSQMIETNQIDHDKIRQSIAEVCKAGADVIVLGCTHYHWIEEEIQEIADKFQAKVIQPEQPVIRQLKRVLKQPL